MQISEFVLGVLSTLSAETVLLIVIGIKMAVSDKKKGGDPSAEESNNVSASTYNRSGGWNDGTGKEH